MIQSIYGKILVFLFVAGILLYVGKQYIWEPFNSSLSYYSITQPNVNYNRFHPGKQYPQQYAKPYSPKLVETFHYESIQGQPEIALLPSGTYSIQTLHTNIPLHPDAFTPVMCNTILLDPKYTQSQTNQWELQEVTQGIYIIKKKNNSECLYASIGNSLKSYLLEEGCQHKNVCGLEGLTEEKKVDSDSKRTYFEVWKLGDGYALKNVETGTYACIKQNYTSFSPSISSDCLFRIEKV